MQSPTARWSFWKRSPSRSAIALNAALRSPPSPDGVPLGPCTRGAGVSGACSLHRYRSASVASDVAPSFCHCGPLAHATMKTVMNGVSLMLRTIGSGPRRCHWTLVLSLAAAGAASAQELEPRAYSNAPVGTSFAILAYTRLSGPVLPDPSVPITDVTARVDILTAGYARFLDLFGHSANFAVLVPYVNADVRGEIGDVSREAHRGGLGDVRVRGAINFFGHRALAPAEFGRRDDVFSGGASLTVIAPTGQYDGSRLINVGSNRWAFKPELGVSHPIGRWFTEASAGAWVFSDNDDFFGAHRRAQEPLAVYQLHAGYNFRRGLWLAGDFGRYIGGRTSVDGAPKEDEQHNSRVGLTLSLPVAAGWSAKLGYSKGTVVRAGGDYRIASIALQYRWLD